MYPPEESEINPLNISKTYAVKLKDIKKTLGFMSLINKSKLHGLKI